MSIKYLPKRMLSGILSAVMAVSVAATPAGALAADTGQGKDISIDEYVASLPGLEEAAGMLAKMKSSRQMTTRWLSGRKLIWKRIFPILRSRRGRR